MFLLEIMYGDMDLISFVWEQQTYEYWQLTSEICLKSLSLHYKMEPRSHWPPFYAYHFQIFGNKKTCSCNYSDCMMCPTIFVISVIDKPVCTNHCSNITCNAFVSVL